LGSASPQRVWSEHSHASDRDTGLPVCTGPDIGAGCESVPACWCGTSGIQLGAGSGQGEPGTERVRTLLRNIRGVPNAVAKLVAVLNAKGLERRKASDCAMVGRVLERGVQHRLGTAGQRAEKLVRLKVRQTQGSADGLPALQVPSCRAAVD